MIVQAFALNSANPGGSIPSIPYIPPRLPEVTTEHHLMWSKNKTNKKSINWKVSIVRSGPKSLVEGSVL